MPVRVSSVYATAPRKDRNCSKRSCGTMFSFCEALIVGCAIVLSALQYSIWSSVIGLFALDVSNSAVGEIVPL